MMKQTFSGAQRLLRNVLWPLTVVLALAWPSLVSASHLRYGSVEHRPTGNVGEIEFRVQYGEVRSGVSGTGSDGFCVVGDTVSGIGVDLGDGNFTNPDYVVVAISLQDDWMVAESVFRYTYASPFSPVLVGLDNCCRISSLTNRADGGFLVKGLVNPATNNRSPISSVVPVVTVPPSTVAQFTVPAADPDGDTLRFRLSTDAEAGGGASPAGLSINANTGVVTWDTTVFDVVAGPRHGGEPREGIDSIHTVQIIIEDLDAASTVKSSTPVDFILQIGTVVGNVPALALKTGPLGLVVKAGTTLSFELEATDVDVEDTLTIGATGLPSGASTTPTLPASGASPLKVDFSWTPSLADLGPHVMFFTATDSTLQQVQVAATITVVEELLFAQQYDLCQGWNLIGLPFIPQVSNPLSLFGTGSRTVKLVRDTRGATNPRKPYQGIVYSYEDASVLEAYQAYFVYIPATGGLSFNLLGTDPGDLTVNLGAGWNLIGTPGAITFGALRQTITQIHTINYWDCAATRYVNLARASTMQGGIGYFAYLVKPALLRYQIDRPDGALSNAETKVKVKRLRLPRP